ncbi:MAG: ABC transporter permease [Marinilabiliales bacterium]|nr:MAG: ABC transporter permease [Marinilabiliales bacterium]
MYKHLLLNTLRNLARGPWFPAITLFGLTIAFACSFTAMIFIFNELSYDRFHENRDRIYRVIHFNESLTLDFAGAPYIIYSKAASEIPQIKKAAIKGFMRDFVVLDKDRQPVSSRLRAQYASREIFDILTFDFLHGDESNMLLNPDELILSRSAASMFFPGTDNPVGLQVSAMINNREELFVVAGVFEDWPELSTFRFDIICHEDWLGVNFPGTFRTGLETNWEARFMNLLVLLNEDADPDDIEKILNRFVPEDDDLTPVTYKLHAMKDFYLGSDHIHNLGYKTGNSSAIFLIAGIAALILFIAVTNSILFLLARFSSRTREIGIRKVIGASKRDVIRMSVIESVLISAASFLLAVMLIELLLPQINEFFRNNLYYHTLGSYRYVMAFAFLTVSIALITGIIGGSRFSATGPVELISGKFSGSRQQRFGIARILLTLQIAILIGMFSASGVIVLQLRYLINMDTGYDIDKLLKIVVRPDNVPVYEPLKQGIRHVRGVESVTGAFSSPPAYSRMVNEIVSPDDPENKVVAHYINVDFDFFETFGIEISQGRAFSEDYPSDRENAIILNRTALNQLRINDPIGKDLKGSVIIGISDDFYLQSHHEPVLPMAIALASPQHIREMIVRYDPEKLDDVLSGIDEVWQEVSASGELIIVHPDRAVKQFYREEETMRKMIIRLTIIAGLIAISGLSVMAVFTARRRNKEIGVRKVNGATTTDIFRLWSLEYMRLVLIALLISTPVVYYILNNWLLNFSNRVSLSWWIFLLAGLVAALTVWISTSVQIYRAASQNPVNLLRYE